MKKGFMLLEVLIATAIGAILLSFECCVFVKFVNAYNKNITTLRDEAYSDEGLIIMKNFIYGNVVEANTENDEINIKTSDNQLNKIYLVKSSGKVIVEYYDAYGYEFKAANVIMENISNMKVVKNGNLLYVLITDNEGKSVSRCFGIKKIY